MSVNLGFNIAGYNVQDKTSLFTYLKANKPRFVLVTDNEQLASEIADLGIENVILRITPNDDEIQTKISSFQAWWTSVKPKYADKRLLVHFCNEPHSNYAKLADLVIQGIAVLDNEGRTGVFGNFGVGTPQPDDPDLARMYSALQGTPHILGTHEYWMYSVDQSMPYEITRYKNFPSNIRIVLTEFGCDFIEDVYNQIKGQKYSGYKTYTNDSYVLAQLQRALNIYNADGRVEGICFFCYGNSGGWQDYDAENFQILLNLVQDYPMLTIRATNGQTNRREQPNTSSPIHGTLSTAVAVLQTGHVDGWTQYQFPDGVFWLADAYVTIVPNKTIQIQLINATDDDVTAFQNAIQVITTLANKYQIQYLDS